MYVKPATQVNDGTSMSGARVGAERAMDAERGAESAARRECSALPGRATLGPRPGSDSGQSFAVTPT
jgi:hypothetical protein